MSYVLDALKKAERERRHQPELGMDNLGQEDWIKPVEPENGNRPGISVLLITFSLCLLAVILTVTLSITREDPQGIPESSVVEQTLSQTPVPVPPILTIEELEAANSVNSESGSVPNVSLAEFLQELRFEGSLYMEDYPEASRVFIDGQAYFVGQTIKEGVYIKGISLDSVVISDGYEEVIRSLR